MRINHKLGPLKVLNQHLIAYPTPINLSYMYNWGSLAGIVLGSQIVTGILLAMHYVGHVDHAFQSVQHLMTDVPSGMILRYAHANGASLFFTVVYMHIFRGIYYSSGNQPREMVWITGVVILLLMIITAFIGYPDSLTWPYRRLSCGKPKRARDQESKRPREQETKRPRDQETLPSLAPKETLDSMSFDVLLRRKQAFYVIALL